MSESRLARIGRDQLSTWLPALMMMLFALGTWWLVRSAPKFPTDGAAAVVSKEPDYFMNQFRVRDFDATGRLTSDLTGVEGHHFPATDTLEVKDPHMRSVDDDGRVTVATALRGVSNGDGSEIQLFGNAVIVREATKRPDGTAVLIDFGAARQISANGTRSLTINVKHGYAPEEQYRRRGRQGPWTDVYALCATIYRLTTGRKPPQALDRLTERERRILHLRYMRGMTQTEVAGRLGISQAQVSRIEKSIIAGIKKEL